MDIQRELLGELNSICEEHDLKYVLGPSGTKLLYVTGNLPDNLSSMDVYMAADDFLKFEKIVRTMDDRFVEYFLNNMDQRNFLHRYGNSKTTYINLRHLRKYNKNGIFINIGIISKPQNSRFKKHISGFLEGFWAAKNKCSNSGRVGIKHFFGSFCGCIAKIFGENTIANFIYNYRKNNFWVKSWDDISKYKYVLVNGKKVHVDIFKDLEENRLGNLKIITPKDKSRYLTDIYGENFENTEMKPPVKGEWIIEDTEIPYSDVIEALESEGYMQEYYENLDSQLRILAGGGKYRKVINKSWNIYLMARQWYDLKGIYGQKKEYFEKLLSNKDYLLLYNELEPFLDFNKKWSDRKVPYISIEKIDGVEKIIDNIEFRNEINKIEENRF